jgi:hypothetical protein
LATGPDPARAQRDRSSAGGGQPATNLVAAGADPLPGTPAARSGPRIKVDEERHDFGVSDAGQDGRHAFMIRNVGDEPLTLSRGRSTCGCCVCVCAVRLPADAVPPGESAQVALEWKSKLYVGPFRQTETVVTNDPDRREVTLSITGRFTGPVGVVPLQANFGSVRVGTTMTREIHLYNYLDEPLAITGFEISDPRFAQFFDVTWETLSDEQLREEGVARGGYLVRVTLRPGLPLGSFEQLVVLTTDTQAVPRVEVPVHGTIVNDLSIVGRGWNADSGVLTMGTVRRRTGAEWSLLIVVRGPQAKEIQLQLLSVDPPWLEVELEPPRHSAETGLTLIPLQVRIPPDSEPSTHLGGERGEPGRITIQAVPPLLPQLDIQVRFAVAE